MPKFYNVTLHVSLLASSPEEANEKAARLVTDHAPNDVNTNVLESDTMLCDGLEDDEEKAEGSAPFRCNSCGHEDQQVEFWPSDGNPEPHICPECSSTNCGPANSGPANSGPADSGVGE